MGRKYESGMIFGNLELIKLDESRNSIEIERKIKGEIKASKTYWLCKCKCGSVISVASSHIGNGHTSSCGCLKKRDLTGEKFGKLTVIKVDEERIKAEREKESNIGKAIKKFYVCKCDCGEFTSVSHGNLVYGSTRTCGCKIGLLVDFTGYKYGRWEVLGLDNNSIDRRWLCRCSCGTIRSLSTHNITSNKSISCGCYGNEVRAEINRQNTKENEFEILDDTTVIGWDTKHQNSFYISMVDFDVVRKYCWSLHDNYWNASSKGEGGKIIKLHQLIMSIIDDTYKPSNELVVDHIDINPSNNIRENLRVVTRAENAKNRHKQKNNTSGKNGVSYSKSKNKWIAYIGVNGKHKYIGGYNDFESAVTARKNAEVIYGYTGE